MLRLVRVVTRPAGPGRAVQRAIGYQPIFARTVSTSAVRRSTTPAAASPVATVAPTAAAAPAATAAAPAPAASTAQPDVIVTTGVDGQKVVIPKKPLARAPPGVRRKREERPSLEAREHELKQRMEATAKLVEATPGVPQSMRKKEKWSLFEVNTNKKPEDKPDQKIGADAVKATLLDRDEKKKSAAATVDATFKSGPSDADLKAKEAQEAEELRREIAEAHAEWDALIARRIPNAIAVRANSHQTGSAAIPIDFSKSRERFKEAADLGCAESMYRYGLMCFLGEGGGVDMVDAYNYLLNSANHGHPESLWRIGVMMYEPAFQQHGIPTDPVKAREFILKSAELGTMDAYEQAALVFRDGIGGEKNIGEAEGWHMRFEEATRDKRVHPHKYVRRFFRKKGDKPNLYILKQAMGDEGAQRVSDAMDARAAEKLRKQGTRVSWTKRR